MKSHWGIANFGLELKTKEICYTDPSWRGTLTLDYKNVSTGWFFFYIHVVSAFECGYNWLRLFLLRGHGNIDLHHIWLIASIKPLLSGPQLPGSASLVPFFHQKLFSHVQELQLFSIKQGRFTESITITVH